MFGKEDEAQEQAFIDTWKWEDEAIDGWHQIQSNHEGRFTEQTIELIKGLHNVLGEESLLAYLISIALRLVEINRVLAPTGSFYLHCDPTASHYLKIIIDSIFLPNGGDYRNEIIWRRSGSHNSAKRFGPIHDVILYYSKSSEIFFRKQYRPYLKEYVSSYFKKTDERGRYRSQTLTGSGTRNKDSGKPWRGFDPTAKGRHWAFPGIVAEDLGIDDGLKLHEKLDILADEGLISQTVDGLPEYRQYLHSSRGVPIQDIWSYQPYTEGVLCGTNDCIDQDVKWLEKRGGDERIGYPTQKPEGLLERIINSSTVEGQTILDAYCGCGTTVAVAQRLKRNWIGIDITYHAIATILARLEDKFGKETADSVVLDGIPKDMQSARALAHKKDDRVRKEFEKWAILTYTNNRAVIRKKKGADGGIDGVYYFWNGAEMESAKMVLQAKSGGVQRKDIAALRGDMEKSGAALACLITLEEPTKPIYKDAKAANFYENKQRGIKCDRIRIVRVEDILRNGERIELPLHPEATNRARRDSEGQQLSLNLRPPTSENEEPKKRKSVTGVKASESKVASIAPIK